MKSSRVKPESVSYEISGGFTPEEFSKLERCLTALKDLDVNKSLIRGLWRAKVSNPSKIHRSIDYSTLTNSFMVFDFYCGEDKDKIDRRIRHNQRHYEFDALYHMVKTKASIE